MNDGDEQISNVNWTWFGILAGTVVLVGVATYLLLPGFVSKTETDITIVKATEGPFKVKLAEPGGKVVNHQDLLVIDILKGGTKTNDQTESLRPEAPSPEPPPVNVIGNASPKTDDVQESTAVVSEQKKKKTDKRSDKSLAKKTATDRDKALRKSAIKKSAAIEEKVKKRVVVIEGNEPLYMIQLAAFRSAKKAAEMAKILGQKHKIRLKKVDLETMRVNTGSNGIFHRVVSIPLPRQDADNMCGILRRSGQDCFLRKYTKATP